jgi:hypothetical protein
MPISNVLRRFLPKFVLAAYGQPDLLKRTLVAYRDSSLSYNMLANPDEALKSFAPLEGLDYYDRVRRQLGPVAGIVKLRTDAVMALPHVWVPGDAQDPESADWAEGVKQAWDAIVERDQAVRKLMLCVAEGVAVGEYVYGTIEVAISVKPNREGTNQKEVGKIDRVETWVVPMRIVDLPMRHFGFDNDLQLRYRPKYGEPQGELVDPMKVVVARYGSTQPWGQGEMRDIVQDAWKLDWVDRKGLEALERQGYPMAQVTVPELWDEERTKSVMAWANVTYKNFMIVRMGDRFDISFPDESVRPTYIGSDQVTRMEQIIDWISIGYLGVSFSNSSTGAKARDQVRNELRFEKASGDSAVFDTIANDFEQKVRDLNRPSMPSYKKARMVTDYKPTEDVVARANVWVQAVSIGYPASKKQLGDEFGLRPALNEADTLQKQIQPTQSGPKNKTQMGKAVSNPAENDNPATSSIAVNSEPRQVRFMTSSGATVEMAETDLVATERGLLEAREVMDGDSWITVVDRGNN